MIVIIILLKNYLGVTEEGASKKIGWKVSIIFFLKGGRGQIILFDEQVLYR